MGWITPSVIRCTIDMRESNGSGTSFDLCLRGVTKENERASQATGAVISIFSEVITGAVIGIFFRVRFSPEM